jgi:hypothetical protein
VYESPESDVLGKIQAVVLFCDLGLFYFYPKALLNPAQDFSLALSRLEITRVEADVNDFKQLVLHHHKIAAVHHHTVSEPAFSEPLIIKRRRDISDEKGLGDHAGAKINRWQQVSVETLT